MSSYLLARATEVPKTINSLYFSWGFYMLDEIEMKWKLFFNAVDSYIKNKVILWQLVMVVKTKGRNEIRNKSIFIYVLQ